MKYSQTLLENLHFPVMLDEVFNICKEISQKQKHAEFLDCTFGGGGYSSKLLSLPYANVTAFDRDKFVSKIADKLQKKFNKRFSFYNLKFSQIENSLGSRKFDAVIFDLGVSNFQLKDYPRGFSFNSRNNLDMRMGDNKISAEKVVNFCNEKTLNKILKIFGNENNSNKIVKNILKERNKKKIYKVEQLTEIIKKSKSTRNKKINPSTKTFQAIRIVVNQEISELINGISYAAKLLKPGGKLITVSFHSIEDKIVKYYFKNFSINQSKGSRYFPEENLNISLFENYKNKVFTPSLKEIKKNPSSRSAKLRYATRNKNKFEYPELLRKKFKPYLDLENECY